MGILSVREKTHERIYDKFSRNPLHIVNGEDYI